MQEREINDQQRAIIDLNTTVAILQQKVMVQKQEMMRSTLRNICSSGNVMLHSSLCAWKELTSSTLKFRMQKHNNTMRAQRQILQNNSSWMAYVLTEWSRAHLAERSKSERTAHEEMFAKANANKMTAMTKQLQRQLQGAERQCFGAWRSAVKASIAKKQKILVGSRMAANSASASVSAVFSVWFRAMSAGKQQALCNKLQDADASTKRRRERAQAVRGTAIVRSERALQSRLVLAWHSIAQKGRLKRAVLRHSRAAGVRIAILRNRRILAEAFIGWLVVLTMRSWTAGRNTLMSIHRVYILRMRSLLLQERCFRSWMRAVPLKPFIAPALQRVPGWLTDSSFLKDPPQIFMRPILGTDRLEMTCPVVRRNRSLSPPSYRRPEIRSATVSPRNNAATYELHEGPQDPNNSEVMPCPIAIDPTRAHLAPGERYVLATRAMTSDVEFKRLLEHNRREIKEQRGEYEIRVAAPGEETTVHGWGIWTG
jgi:hypothetical protein